MTIITTKYRNRRKGNCLIILSILIYFLRGFASFLCLRNGSAILQTWFNEFVFNNEFTERCLLMKLKITTIIAAGLLFAGCAATTPVEPTLEYSNDEPYVWDDNKSLALNITKASIDTPPSLRDTALPEGASITQSGSWKDSAAVVDLLSNGLGGLFVGELFRGIDKNNWMPTYVWLEEDTGGTPKSYSDVMTDFKNRLEEMLRDVEELSLIDVVTEVVYQNQWNSSTVILAGQWCNENEIGFGSHRELSDLNFVDVERGFIPFEGEGCLAPVRVNVVQKLIKRGVEYNVYSVSIGTMLKYAAVASLDFDGYFLQPARANEIGSSNDYGYGYPFVIHNKQIHLFTNPEKIIEFSDL